MAGKAVAIELVKMDEGRWRALIDDEDTGISFQFPWDALQCALNGSLTGEPLQNIQKIAAEVTDVVDQKSLARIRSAETERRALLAALRGIDGDGI